MFKVINCNVVVFIYYVHVVFLFNVVVFKFYVGVVFWCNVVDVFRFHVVLKLFTVGLKLLFVMLFEFKRKLV
jgi:hypothetical protein